MLRRTADAGRSPRVCRGHARSQVGVRLRRPPHSAQACVYIDDAVRISTRTDAVPPVTTTTDRRARKPSARSRSRDRDGPQAAGSVCLAVPTLVASLHNLQAAAALATATPPSPVPASETGAVACSRLRLPAGDRRRRSRSRADDPLLAERDARLGQCRGPFTSAGHAARWSSLVTWRLGGALSSCSRPVVAAPARGAAAVLDGVCADASARARVVRVAKA